MTKREIDKLLGGYATGTLTEEERRRLFEAALDDQALFDALTQEDALKEVLDDPQHRRRLLAALEAARASRGPLRVALAWLRRPTSLAVAGTVAAAVLAVWVFVGLERHPAVTPPESDQVVRLLESRQRTEPRPDIGGAPLEQKPARPARLEKPRVARDRSGAPGRAGPGAGSPPPAPSRPAEQKVQTETRKAAPPAVSAQGRPVWLTSYRRPVEPGPARQLYYARLAPAPHWDANEVRSSGVPSGPGEEAERALEPFGLRYSVLQQDEAGDFQEAGPEGPFEADDAMRVTVEVNETGYLYVFRLGPRGEWRWISPSGPLGKHVRPGGVGVLSGKRYVIPGTGVLPLYGEPSANKMILIYSRQPRQELQIFHPAVLERQEGDDRPSADLETLLSRARVETSTQPLLVEEVHSGEAEGAPERAVYIVNPEADRDAAIAIELTFPSG